MPLDVKLEAPKDELLLGEDMQLKLKLTNTGPGEVSTIRPTIGVTPTFRVVHTDTGAEVLSKGDDSVQRPRPPLKLAIGTPVQHYLTLKEYVTFLVPGTYAVSAIYPYNNNKAKAESNALRLKVRPLACRNLRLDLAHGDLVTGAFINSANEKPDVVLARFAIRAGGGVEGIFPIGKGTLLSAPAKSNPPITRIGNGDWIAWMDGDTLSAVHWLRQAEANPEDKIRLPDAKHSLIAPLFIQPREAGGPRGEGEALVWADRNGTTYLHRVKLQADRKAKLRLASSTPVPGTRPVWSMSYAPSDARPRLLALREAGDVVALSNMPWPEGGLVAEKQLREWRGELVAAGATVRVDDTLRGAMLLRVGSGDDSRLELVGWSVAADGKVEETFREVVPWAPSVPIAVARVKVRITGMPAVLLRKQEGAWSVFDAFGKMMEVPKPYNESKLPLDFVFWGLREVVLIAAETKGGFSVKRMNGENLPPEAT